MLGVRSVYVKRFVKDRTAADVDLRESLFSPTPLIGEPAPPQVEVHEHGLLFAIRPYDGFSVGLFPDQRDNRKRIREMAAGKEVLNLFAYTCGFSAAAAAGGAKSVTSVDLSPKHLEWGKVNVKLNTLDASAHEFVAADAMDYLGRAAKHERRFDIIVIDAPTFAHGRKAGKDFSMERDLPALVAATAKVLRKAGTMMVSTNNRKLSHKSLREKIRQGASRRRVEFTDTPPLPLDYAVDPDHAKTIFARLE
jgi:23S rRNA (cytosine1962-C5)-methyltransferase